MGSVAEDKHTLAGPVDDLRAALPELRRPFAPNALKFKVANSVGGNRNICLPYIDARLVFERLNLVVGEAWSDRYEIVGERVDSGLMWCHLTIHGVTRSDVGKGQGDVILKAAVSDAAKRAAVHFGVGVSLYAMGRYELNVTDDGHLVSDQPTLHKNQKGKPAMNAQALAFLRGGYKEWAEGAGEKKFGTYLDHGDVEDSLGDPVEVEIEQGGGEAEAEDPELADGRVALEAHYDEVTKADVKKRRAFRPAEFRAQLANATSTDDLEELRAKIDALEGSG